MTIYTCANAFTQHPGRCANWCEDDRRCPEHPKPEHAHSSGVCARDGSPKGRDEDSAPQARQPGSEGTRPEKSSEREAPSVQVVEPLRRFLQDTLQEGTANERSVARTALKLLEAALPAAQQPASPEDRAVYSAIAAGYFRDTAKPACEAAAPELLHACEQAVEWLEGWASAEPYIGVLRAVIAKAKAAAQQPAVEPVAWYDPNDFTRTSSKQTEKEWAPLYASPTAQPGEKP